MSDLHLRITKLQIPFRTEVRHASAARQHGASILVEAERDGLRGLGEGCPRSYVTGETMDSCIDWLESRQDEIRRECGSLSDLDGFADSRVEELSGVPSAWCALESALLDLFARERKASVEAMLGLPSTAGRYRYTAVVPISPAPVFGLMVDQYLAHGFTDFKVKLSGIHREDIERLKVLSSRCLDADGKIRLRLDANNIWADHPEEALRALESFDTEFFAVEEPVAPRDAVNLSRIGQALDTAIILDESACSPVDLRLFDELPGRFVLNIKVSKAGGLRRSLALVDAARRRSWPVIVGAHVGETSLLTRVALTVASAAGDALIGHEGGYGTLLLEEDPVVPGLRFGAGGVLDRDDDQHSPGWGLSYRE